MVQEINKLEPIQAIERAFSILEIISRKRSMSLNALCKETKISKASLLRIVFTLAKSGYLEKNPQTGDYSMTLKTYELGSGALQNIDKLTLINSTLVDLHQQTDRVAQFSIEDNNQLLCLQSLGQKSSLFSLYTNMGVRSPLYSTSAGKAILATYSNSQILSKWASFEAKPLTKNTHTDVQSLLQDLSEVRRRQYALDMEENEYGVFCVGAVIRNHTNAPVGAISISGSTLTAKEIDWLSGILLPAVQRLSELMGYIAPNP